MKLEKVKNLFRSNWIEIVLLFFVSIGLTWAFWEKKRDYRPAEGVYLRVDVPLDRYRESNTGDW